MRRVKKTPQASSYQRSYTQNLHLDQELSSAFVASLIDDVNQKDVEQWGIIAVSLHSEDTFNKLVGQDFVFNAVSMIEWKKTAPASFLN